MRHWGWPDFMVRRTDDSVVYTLEQTSMAGASDRMEIAVYASDDDALFGFGVRTGTFVALPAQRSESASYYPPAAHYQDLRSLRFLCGRRVFATSTGYNSTVCGGAQDPDEVGATLLAAALLHGLPPGIRPTPPAMPTAVCDVPLEVDPVPCMITESRPTVTGTSRAGCTVTVEGGRGSNPGAQRAIPHSPRSRIGRSGPHRGTQVGSPTEGMQCGRPSAVPDRSLSAAADRRASART